jgi:hypothetical protein
MKIGGGDGLYVAGHNYLAFVGLKFYASTRDPQSGDSFSTTVTASNSNGVKFLYSNKDILLEDNYISHTNDGVVIQSSNATGGPNAGCWSNLGGDIVFRRNVVAYSYRTAGHTQGIFYHGGSNTPSSCPGQPVAGEADFLAEGNLLYHNGWYGHVQIAGSGGTMFNRNGYISYGYGNTNFTENITAEGSSGGIQLRMGGTAVNNLFLKEPDALSFGHNENTGNVTIGGLIKNNVVLGASNIYNTTETQLGYGISFGGVEVTTPNTGPSYIDGLNVFNNIVSSANLDSESLRGFNMGGSGRMSNVDFYNNVVYDWVTSDTTSPNDRRSCALYMNVVSTSVNVDIHDNSFQQPNKGFAACAEISPLGVTFNSNSFFSTSPDSAATWNNGWFQILGNAAASATWFTQFADSGASLSAVSYPDPDRSVETYMDSIGETPTYDAFISEAMQQSRTNWRTEFTADTVNDYIRAGFNMDQAMDTTSERNLATAHSSGQNILTRFFIAVGREVLGFARWFFGLFY